MVPQPSKHPTSGKEGKEAQQERNETYCKLTEREVKVEGTSGVQVQEFEEIKLERKYELPGKRG